MDYIRDHYKAIAFNVLKVRIDPLSEDPYTTIKEIILELYSMFGDYNKLAKYSTILYDPVFTIKKYKVFNYFYTRFSATITPMGYSESNKIAALRRLITTKLQLRIVGIPSSTPFRSFVEQLRMIDQDLRQLEASMDVEEIDEAEFNSDRSRSPLSEQYLEHPQRSSYLEQLKAQLKKEDRCFKYLDYNYRPNETEACRKSALLLFKEVKAKLAKEKAVEKE